MTCSPGVIRPEENYTAEQQTAVSKASSLSGGAHLKIVAAAGAGKTHTLVGIANAMPARRACYFAFNATVAREAKTRFAGTNCQPMTTHAFAFHAMRDEMAGGVATYRAKELVDSGFVARCGFRNLRGWSPYRLAAAILRTVTAYAASDAIRVERHHAHAAITTAVGDPDTMFNSELRDRASASLAAFTIPMQAAAQQFVTDRFSEGVYSHELYLKAFSLNSARIEQARRGLLYGLVDEAQDLAPVQIAILKAMDISMVYVGDNAQSIYGWRGAENALEEIAGEETYLSQSFRFGEGIAALARQILASSPEPHRGPPLTGVGGQKREARKETCAVITRTNLGMLDEAPPLMLRGFSVYIDRKEELLNLVRSAVALYENRLRDIVVPELQMFLTWAQFCEEAEFNPAFDRLVRIVEEGRAADVERMLEASVSEQAADVTIIGAHRAKGREWDAVRIANDWPDLATMRDNIDQAAKKSPRKAVQEIQNLNAFYVAVTRARLRVSNHAHLMT